MKPQDFIKELKRMHNSQKCGTCKVKNLPCLSYMCCDEKNFAELYSEVEKWSDAHPVKTRQSEFLKIFPEIRPESNGAISVAPCSLFPNLNKENKCYKWHDCADCKKDFWLTPVDEPVNEREE